MGFFGSGEELKSGYQRGEVVWCDKTGVCVLKENDIHTKGSCSGSRYFLLEKPG